MTAPTAPEAAPRGAPESPQPQSRTADAIAEARQRLSEGRSLVEPSGDTATPETPPEEMVVRLEGLPERGEADVEFEAPDAETYNVLSRLQQEAVVGREVRQEQRGVADLRRQLTEVEDLIAVDPSGLVLGHLPEHTRTQVAMALLFQPGVLEAIEAAAHAAQGRAGHAGCVRRSGTAVGRRSWRIPRGAEPKRPGIPGNPGPPIIR